MYGVALGAYRPNLFETGGSNVLHTLKTCWLHTSDTILIRYCSICFKKRHMFGSLLQVAEKATVLESDVSSSRGVRLV